MNIHQHSQDCSAGYHRAAWRKANDPLTDSYRDRLILDAIDAGHGYDGIQATLNQARADIADGIVDGEGRLTWNYG